MADLLVERQGSIFLLDPVTDLRPDWVAAHIPEDATRFGGAGHLTMGSVFRPKLKSDEGRATSRIKDRVDGKEKVEGIGVTVRTNCPHQGWLATVGQR